MLGDGTGTIAATWYHYQSWLKQRFKVGERYLFTGDEGPLPDAAPTDEDAENAIVQPWGAPRTLVVMRAGVTLPAG